MSSHLYQGRNEYRTRRSAVGEALYSLVLNGGYAPPAVYLYGDDQWSPPSRAFLRQALPFAQLVGPGEVERHLRAVGGGGLYGAARQAWRRRSRLPLSS